MDDLDKLFNKLINAKEVAVNTVAKSMDLFSNAEIATEANKLLDRLREEFKADIASYSREARIEHLDTLNRVENVAEQLSDEDWQILGARKRSLENLSEDNCQICGDGGHTEFDCPNTGKLSEVDDE